MSGFSGGREGSAAKDRPIPNHIPGAGSGIVVAGFACRYNSGELLLSFHRRRLCMAAEQQPDNPRRRRRRGLPGPVEPLHPALLRQSREQRNWLSRRENVEKYAGQIVAVYNSEVWGHGPDHSTVVKSLQEKLAATPASERPPEGELAFFIVPNLLTPDDYLPEA
jgi:hypothetical protein